MTKEEIKTLCDADGQLQWWAMVLFAEISELIQSGTHGGYEPKIIYPLVVSKTKEFERLIIQRAMEKSTEVLSLEDRVKRLEEKVGV